MTARSLRRVTVFVASPSDVQAEREQLAAVVTELNQTVTTLVPEAGLVLELVRWETHIHPGIGADPQDVVSQQVHIADLDVFVGIFWLRFGTPTPRAGSGTEEEFWIAHRAWKERDRAIQLMVYFCREPAPPPKDSAAAEQLAKVARFREALSREGLVRDFGAHAEFAAHVRRDLVLVLGQILHPASAPAAIAAQTAQLAPADDLGSARRALEALANEYDAVRDPVTGLPSGAERTRRMELIASRMRSLALSAYPLLDELQTSTSAGHRLAAVTILQAIPDVRHLDWLAGRLPAEKPFVGYHAAVALLVAARSLALADLPAVESALDLADAQSRGLRIDADRATTLREARSELHRRSATRPVN